MNQSTIYAATLFGRLIFKHQGTKVTVTGEASALSYWKDLQRLGLYGAYGHIFQPNDCLVSDITIALIAALGVEAVSWSASVEKQRLDEMKLLPKGFIP